MMIGKGFAWVNIAGTVAAGGSESIPTEHFTLYGLTC